MEITITYYLESNHLGTLKHRLTKNNEYKPWCISIDYEAEINLDVIKLFYINEMGLSAYKDQTRERQIGIERALEFMWKNDLISRERLEHNKNFMDFITDYYEYCAIEEYETESEEDEE